MPKPSTRKGNTLSHRAPRRTGKATIHSIDRRGKWGTPGVVKPAATAAAVVLGAGTVATLGYVLRRELEDVAHRARSESRRIGKGMASTGTAIARSVERFDLRELLERAGLRARRPFYMRALPVLGAITGLLAAGAAAMLFGPRWKALHVSSTSGLRSTPATGGEESRDAKPTLNNSIEREDEVAHAH